MDFTQLAEIEQIKTLKAKYFYYMDTRQWDGWRNEVHCADVAFTIPETRPEPYVGLENILEFLIPFLEGSITIHHGHMPMIELTSPTKAKGIWAMEDVIYWPNGVRPDGVAERVQQGYGHYHETYVKEPRGWRIKTLRLTRLYKGLP